MEEKLLIACHTGDIRAQRELYDRYFAYVMTICLQYATDRPTAEEMLQDTFVKVFRKLDTFRAEGNFRAWLRRICIHCAIDHLRKHRQPLFVVGPLESEVPDSVANEALRRLEREDVLRILQRLPISYRLVFNLFVLEDFTHAEIAKELDISIGTSKSNLSRARQKLRELASDYLANHQSKKYV